jgi:hypothetical protein
MNGRTSLWTFLASVLTSSLAFGADCRVTGGGIHGNDALDVVLPPAGKFVFRPNGPGFIDDRDGALGMKLGFGLKIPGQLEITGRRLDGPAARARAYTSLRHADPGGQAVYMVFPTPGCWELVASIGQQSFTFVVAVELIAPGPSSHLNGVPRGWRETGG